jgi:thioredoxin-related protein
MQTKIISISKYFLALFICLWVIGCKAKNSDVNVLKSDADVASNASHQPAKIQWMTFEEAVEANSTNPKKIFIDFYTSWCGWCKVMDNKTFDDTIIAKMMQDNFYCVKFNAEDKKPITFKEKTYNYAPNPNRPDGERGYHELAAGILNGQMSFPSFVFMTPNFEIITPISGYVPKEEWEPIVSFIGNDHWLPEKNTSFEDYKAAYKLTPR